MKCLFYGDLPVRKGAGLRSHLCLSSAQKHEATLPVRIHGHNRRVQGWFVHLSGRSPKGKTGHCSPTEMSLLPPSAPSGPLEGAWTGQLGRGSMSLILSPGAKAGPPWPDHLDF